MTIRKISHESTKLYATSTGHRVKVTLKEDVQNCAITAYMTDAMEGAPHEVWSKVYESSCDYAAGKKGAHRSLQYFLQTQLPILCANADAICAPPASEPQTCGSRSLTDRETVCENLCRQVLWELELLAKDGDLPGICRYMLDHYIRVDIQVNDESGKVVNAHWVMHDDDGLLVIADAATATIIGAVDGVHSGHLHMTECLAVAVNIFGEIYWDVNKRNVK